MTPPTGDGGLPSLFEVTHSPVVAYRVEEDTPRVVRVNPAFETTFHDVGEGTPLAAALPLDEGFVDAVGSGEDPVAPFRTDEGRAFVARDATVGTDGTGEGGYVTCTEVTDIRNLEERNRRLEEFADVLAHDIRNPLEAARIRLEVAVESGELEHVPEALSALDRAEEIVENSLALAREGRSVGDPERLRLREVAADAWSTTDTAEATLEFDGDLPAVDGDESRLRRLFENLFRNAVEHGGREVTVTVAPLEDGSGFAVADDGPGIPPEARDRVFELGFTTSDGGNGLGLTIVERIAQAHGWTVSVAEAEDGGARFVFSDVDGTA